MPSSEELVQEAVLAALDAAVPQPVHEQGIPDTQTVLRTSGGAIRPYYALQFGDITENRGGNSFTGPRGDDYDMAVYVQAIAATIKDARKMSNRVKDAMLGLDFPWSGNIRKRAGGGQGTITASNGATEAYVAATSFTVVIQYMGADEI